MDGFPDRALRLRDRFAGRRAMPFSLLRENTGGPDAAQRGGEFLTLLEYYMAMRPKRILEIGTYHGGTLWYWMKYAQPGATVVSIDIDHDQCTTWDRIRRPDVELITITGRSDSEETRARAGAPFDFVFIDGCHLFPTVRTDWEWYGLSAKACAFHDIACGLNPTKPQDIRVLWDEICETYPNTVSLIESEPADHCFGIGIVEP